MVIIADEFDPAVCSKTKFGQDTLTAGKWDAALVIGMVQEVIPAILFHRCTMTRANPDAIIFHDRISTIFFPWAKEGFGSGNTHSICAGDAATAGGGIKSIKVVAVPDHRHAF